MNEEDTAAAGWCIVGSRNAYSMPCNNLSFYYAPFSCCSPSQRSCPGYTNTNPWCDNCMFTLWELPEAVSSIYKVIPLVFPVLATGGLLTNVQLSAKLACIAFSTLSSNNFFPFHQSRHPFRGGKKSCPHLHDPYCLHIKRSNTVLCPFFVFCFTMSQLS